MAHIGRDLVRSHLKTADRMVWQQRAFGWKEPHSALFFSQPGRKILLLIHSQWPSLWLSLTSLLYITTSLCVFWKCLQRRNHLQRCRFLQWLEVRTRGAENLQEGMALALPRPDQEGQGLGLKCSLHPPLPFPPFLSRCLFSLLY